MPESKHRVSVVYPKVRAAIAILLSQEKYDLAAAAAGAGLTIQRLRDYLARPSVRKYLRDQRRVQIESLCASNATALARVRDEAENSMAVVNAVRQAETMRARLIEEDGEGTSTRPMPGLVIVLQSSERGVTVEHPQRLAGVRTVESIAYERGPDKDDLEDEALAVRPAGRRVRP
jgi:hypothetical protein